MKVGDITSLEELTEIVKATTKEVEHGEKFIVKDLFRGFEWNRISKSDHTKFGSMSLNFAKNEDNKIIKVTKKTPQNQQQYIKL